jgi:hypothetical protein
MEYKGPNEEYPFIQDWTTTLSGLTITTSVWTVPAPLTSLAESFTSSEAQIKVGGGVAGRTYRITNQITASNGDVFERDWFLRVRRGQAT